MSVTPELIQYVKEAQSAGMSEQAIIEALKDYGWTETLLTVGLKSLQEADGFYYDQSYPVPEESRHRHAKPQPKSDIVVENISKSFGDVKAVEDVTFNVKPGAITALLGPNGAGKTTIIKMLTTLISPDSGTARVAGCDIKLEPAKLREAIGLAGQSAAVDEILTGYENLELVGKLYHLGAERAKTRAWQLLEQFDLVDAADRQVKTYSGGMRRRLDLAASLVGDPKILFLDEPTAGLDPRSRVQLWDTINDLVKKGTTILLTTQYLEEADNLADFIVVIDHGRLIAQGTADELKSNAGGDVVEIFINDLSQLDYAARTVAGIGKGLPSIYHSEGKITIPVSGGAWALAPVIKRLDSAKIEILDIRLRRPTLDDVFLSLTGHTAAQNQN